MKLKKNGTAYPMACNLKMACLWSLNLDQYNPQQYILNYQTGKHKMHFCPNFKKLYKGHRFIVKNVLIKNICDVVELHKNSRNPLYDFWQQSFEMWKKEKAKN